MRRLLSAVALSAAEKLYNDRHKRRCFRSTVTGDRRQNTQLLRGVRANGGDGRRNLPGFPALVPRRFCAAERPAQKRGIGSYRVMMNTRLRFQLAQTALYTFLPDGRTHASIRLHAEYFSGFLPFTRATICCVLSWKESLLPCGTA